MSDVYAEIHVFVVCHRSRKVAYSALDAVNVDGTRSYHTARLAASYMCVH